MKSLEGTIRHQLRSYLTDGISLDEFTAWLIGATWNMENADDAATSQLAYAIELSLAEYTSGLLTLDELRAELRDLSQDRQPSLSTPA